MTRTQNHHRQTRHRSRINVISRKEVKNTGNTTRQTHHQATILNPPMTVITDASNNKRRDTQKRIQSNYAKINRKVADDSVIINDHLVQNG